MIAQLDETTVSPEMSTDRRFRGRLRRLVVVSAIMLGAITLLAVVATNAPPAVIGVLALGWVLMPTLLYASMERPRLRHLLVLPATLVAVGLIAVATGLEGSPMADVGWWLVAGGVLFGGALGMWFWYRWLPVPRALDDPFSAGRITMIVIHVAMIMVGMGLVIFA